jgi:hypothetical protein
LFELQRDVEMIWNHPWLFWILVLAATTFAMLVITFLARWFEYPFRYLWMWGLVLVLIFIAPFLIPKESYVTYFELMLGIAFATFYPRLGKILKQEPS